jgi:hypothetical protein
MDNDGDEEAVFTTKGAKEHEDIVGGADFSPPIRRVVLLRHRGL